MESNNKIKDLVSRSINLKSSKYDLESKRAQLIKKLKTEEYNQKSELLSISNRIKELSDNIAKVDVDFNKEFEEDKRQNLAEIKKTFLDELNSLKLKESELLNSSPNSLGIEISDLDIKIIELNREISITDSEVILSTSRVSKLRELSIENSEKSDSNPVSYEDISSQDKVIDRLDKLEGNISNKLEEFSKNSSKSGLSKSLGNIKNKISKTASKLNPFNLIKSASKLNPFNLIKSAKNSVTEKVDDVKDKVKSALSNTKDKLTPDILKSKKDKLGSAVSDLSRVYTDLNELKLGVHTANINIYRLMKTVGFIASATGYTYKDDESVLNKLRNKYSVESFEPSEINKNIEEHRNKLSALGEKSPSTSKISKLSSKVGGIFKKAFGMVKKIFGAVGNGIMTIFKLIPLGSIIGPILAVVGGFFLVKKLINTEFGQKIKEQLSGLYENYIKPHLDPIIDKIKSMISNLWNDHLKPGLAKVMFPNSPDPVKELDNTLGKIFSFLKKLPDIIKEAIFMSLQLKLASVLDDAADSLIKMAQTTGAGAGLGVGAGVAGAIGIAGGVAKVASAGLRAKAIYDMGKKLMSQFTGFGSNSNVNLGELNKQPSSEVDPKVKAKEEGEDSIFKKIKDFFIGLLPSWLGPSKSQSELDDIAEKALDDDSVDITDKADLIQDASQKRRTSESLELGKKLFESGNPAVKYKKWSVDEINAYYDYVIDMNTHWHGDNDEAIIQAERERLKILKLKESYENGELDKAAIQKAEENDNTFGQTKAEYDAIYNNEVKKKSEYDIQLEKSEEYKQVIQDIDRLETDSMLLYELSKSKDKDEWDKRYYLEKMNETEEKLSEAYRRHDEISSKILASIEANTQLTASGIQANLDATNSVSENLSDSSGTHLESINN